ncbi:hypothetical protein [Fodinicola feengrottensis]|uniref:Uncharacterized protein n=2 Tax=Fodinicola feengrottensis TaxID=435914 RepID=A0ABN2FQ56_9ACTN|nr:hypothetical protein [Fodinicola feengrottensis]
MPLPNDPLPPAPVSPVPFTPEPLHPIPAYPDEPEHDPSGPLIPDPPKPPVR